MESYSFAGLKHIQVSSHHPNGESRHSYLLYPSSTRIDVPSVTFPSLTDSTLDDSNTRILCLNIGIPISADTSMSRLEISLSSFTEEATERSDDRIRIQEIGRSTVIDSSNASKDVKSNLSHSSPPKKEVPSMFQETVDDWNSEIPIYELEEVNPPRRLTLTNGIPSPATTKSKRSPTKQKKSSKHLPKSEMEKQMAEPPILTQRPENSRRSLLATSRSMRHPRLPPGGTTSSDEGRTADTRWARWSSTRMLRGLSTPGLVKKGGV
jgi:hypothetical protein